MFSVVMTIEDKILKILKLIIVSMRYVMSLYTFKEKFLYETKKTKSIFLLFHIKKTK
jgi:hypothetical protein